MGNRVRLTNDTLNSYGYRVLTEGVDTTQYERTPYSCTCTAGDSPSGL